MDSENTEFGDIEEAMQEIARLRRTLSRRERDIKVLTRVTETADKLRNEYERDKKLQSLYNELLLSNTPDMIFLFNRDLEYVIGSKAGSRLTGLKHNNLLLRPLPRIFSDTLDPEWVEKLHHLNHEALLNRSRVCFNDRISVANSPVIHATITIAPMVDEDGECHGTIMSIHDITELAAARQQAEDAAKSKAAFLANMSHEIRTPMNAIKGLSELLALTRLDAVQQSYVKNIVGSANSLINIINDVLDFSKIDANRIELCPAPYSVQKLLAELCVVIGLRAEEKGLTLLMEIDPAIPAHLIGDDARIKQVLINLLSNAVKYTPGGRVLLHMSASRAGENRVELECRIEDTGIGIKAEDTAYLFNAFSRVDAQANRRIQGTGLGLAISKRLAEAMGGAISVASVHGQGSVFTFSLPQEISDSEPLASLEDAGNTRVLLIGHGERAANAETMLNLLGVSFVCLGYGDGDAPLPDRLAAAELSCPSSRGTPSGPFTHCIYFDTLPEEIVEQFRLGLPDCRFAAIRSIITSMDEGRRHDAALFNPLLITELARFLNRSGSPTRQREAPAGDTAMATRLRTRNVRALVVDDNRINLIVCEKMLNLYGVEATTVASGPEAVKVSMTDKFDILFVDHMMPDMDGIEVTRELRSRPGPNRETPIIALTANVVNDMRSQYIQCGMDDFVGKPIDRAELTRVLLHWLPAEKIIQGNGPSHSVL